MPSPTPVKVREDRHDSGHKAQMAIAHHNIAVELEHLSQAGTALTYFAKAMEIATEIEQHAVAATLFEASKAAFQVITRASTDSYASTHHFDT